MADLRGAHRDLEQATSGRLAVEQATDVIVVIVPLGRIRPLVGSKYTNSYNSTVVNVRMLGQTSGTALMS
jgi:hypothetical protein